MSTALNFDLSTVQPDAGGFGEPIPKGWYNMMVDESSIEPTKDNSSTGGLYAKLRFAVMDGQYAGRKVYKNFNIKNASEMAEKIGRGQLAAVAHAVGVPGCTDTMQLHGIPLKGRVVIEAGGNKPDGSGAYPDKNEINSFKNINEAVSEEKDTAAVNPFAKSGPPATQQFTPPPGVAPAPVAAPVAAPAAPVAAPAAPVAAPAAPVAAPAAPVAPAPAAPVFPPAGWTVHPQNPSYYYKGEEVKSEADLRASMAPAVPVAPAPAVPVAPPSFPAVPAVAAPATQAPAIAAAQGTPPPWAK